MSDRSYSSPVQSYVVFRKALFAYDDVVSKVFIILNAVLLVCLWSTVLRQDSFRHIVSYVWYAVYSNNLASYDRCVRKINVFEILVRCTFCRSY